jgi:hypothetical protein
MPLDPQAPPRPATTTEPIPWAEVAALVVGSPTVIGIAAEDGTTLPAGWRTDPEGTEGPVVLVAPRDEAAVRAASDLAGGHRLLVVLPNLARPAFVRALLLGAGDDHFAPEVRSALARATVDRVAQTCGRRLLADPGPVTGEPTGRPLDDLLISIARNAGGHDRAWVVRAYDVWAPAEADEDNRPPSRFLSVLVRTQGRRPDALADVLLCLAAQSDDDFELLLLAHDVLPTDRVALDQALAALPAGLRARTKLVEVTGGGRARPLAVGVAEARGEYIAVLDDDDLVLGDWVAAFHAAATSASGSIVRSLTMEQDVELVTGNPGFRSVSWPTPRWEREFSLLSHVVDNHSPIHSYALPRAVFHELGLAFDETLPVLEDWDLLVRAASLVGVRDTGQVTAIYRRWPTTHSSFASVDDVAWRDVAWRVVRGWDRTPLLLPAQSATRLREEGIYVLVHRPLAERVRNRVDRWRDRWSPWLMTTPVGRPLRSTYRRLRRRLDP